VSRCGSAPTTCSRSTSRSAWVTTMCCVSERDEGVANRCRSTACGCPEEPLRGLVVQRGECGGRRNTAGFREDVCVYLLLDQRAERLHSWLDGLVLLGGGRFGLCRRPAACDVGGEVGVADADSVHDRSLADLALASGQPGDDRRGNEESAQRAQLHASNNLMRPGSSRTEVRRGPSLARSGIGDEEQVEGIPAGLGRADQHLVVGARNVVLTEFTPPGLT